MTSNRPVRRLVVPVLMALALTTLAGRSAAASTIHWRIDAQVEGTVVGFLPGAPPMSAPVAIPVAAGTPLSIDLTFDSGTPNTCFPGRGGVYAIGGFSGNSAVMHFLGADYVAPGGIETGVLGPCGSDANAAALRLFVGGGSRVDSTAPLVQFIPAPGFGNFFITLPPPPDGHSLPVVLPIDPFPTGISHLGDNPGNVGHNHRRDRRTHGPRAGHAQSDHDWRARRRHPPPRAAIA